MLDMKELLARILAKIGGGGTTVLSSAKHAAASVSTTYTYTTVSALANWDVVTVWCGVNNVNLNLVFSRAQGAAGALVSDTPNSSSYIRGGFVVDWANNRIGIRCTNGTDVTVSTVYYTYVIGIVRRA